jgi:hypothetical protein
MNHLQLRAHAWASYLISIQRLDPHVSVWYEVLEVSDYWGSALKIRTCSKESTTAGVRLNNEDTQHPMSRSIVVCLGPTSLVEHFFYYFSFTSSFVASWAEWSCFGKTAPWWIKKTKCLIFFFLSTLSCLFFPFPSLFLSFYRPLGRMAPRLDVPNGRAKLCETAAPPCSAAWWARSCALVRWLLLLTQKFGPGWEVPKGEKLSRKIEFSDQIS